MSPAGQAEPKDTIFGSSPAAIMASASAFTSTARARCGGLEGAGSASGVAWRFT